MKRYRVFIISVFVILFGVPAVADCEKINVIGEASEFGIYDPSVEYDENGVGWLAYTAAESDNIQLMGTHLAKSTDHGKTWTFVGKANSESKKVMVINGVETEVNYRQETASLLFDPSDPDTNKRWKLFTARGSIKTGGKYHDTDWGAVQIVYRYAPSPEQLYPAKEIYLFGSSACRPPVCSVEYNLNNFNPDLKNVVFYEEPGTLAKGGVLYLTLSAVTSKGQKTILLSSKDHAETWGYVGTLTTREDAKSLGYNELTSSSMAEEDGRQFLLISPVKAVHLPRRHLQYKGVYVFEFEDISKARLKRDNSGKLIVRKYIPPLDVRSVGGGQSEYDEQNTYGGIVMAQSAPSAPKERFKIFNTKKRICEL